MSKRILPYEDLDKITEDLFRRVSKEFSPEALFFIGERYKDI